MPVRLQIGQNIPKVQQSYNEPQHQIAPGLRTCRFGYKTQTRSHRKCRGKNDKQTRTVRNVRLFRERFEQQINESVTQKNKHWIKTSAAATRFRFFAHKQKQSR